MLRFTIYVPHIRDFCTVCAGADLLEAQGVIKIMLKKNRCGGMRPVRSHQRSLHRTAQNRTPLHRTSPRTSSRILRHPTPSCFTSFIGKPAPGGYRDGNFVFELCATECLVEMQILIREFADIKSEAHESYEVSEGVVGFCALS